MNRVLVAMRDRGRGRDESRPYDGVLDIFVYNQAISYHIEREHAIE